MSWGQSFGSFAGGMSNGMGMMQQYKAGAARRQEQQPSSAIDEIITRPAPTRNSTEEVDEVTQDSSAKTWQIIRDMGSTNFEAPEQQQQQSSGGGSSFNPQMMQKFMGSGSAGGSSGLAGGMGSAGGGLGGSGLIGSSSGAMSAGANGGASFGLGGSLVGGSGTVGGSTFAAGSGGAAAGGGAGGGAAGGAAAAGPWAALAAVIIANENTQKKTGNRREGTQYYKDLIGGKVFEQDMNKYADKWDKDNKLGVNSDMKTIGNLNTFDFSNAWKNAKKGGIAGGLLKKIF